MSRRKRRSRRRKKSNLPAESATPTVESPPSPEEQPLSSQEFPPEDHGPRRSSLVRFHGEKFVGPIPPAKHLAEYEAVRPGTADWIVERATKQHDHQIDVEDRSVDAAIATEKRGQWLTFVLLLVLLAVVAFGVIPAAERLLTHVFYALLAVFGIGNLPKWISDWRNLFVKEDEPDSLPPDRKDD